MAKHAHVNTQQPHRGLVLLLTLLLALIIARPAGYAQTPNAVIRGRVWQDLNRNGHPDPDEAGLAHVEIRLYRDNSTPFSITYTQADGSFRFTGLLPDTYYIRETDLAGYLSSTPNEVHVTLAQGQVLEIDFGDYPVTLLTPTPTPTPSPSPSSTPTPTATPTPTTSPTPLPTPIPTPTPPATVTPTPPHGTPTPWPEWCRNIVRNPSFEEDEGWELPRTRLWPAYVGPSAFPEGSGPHSFLRAVRLGATAPIDPPSYSSAAQLITLPRDARIVTLEYWVWTFSQDPDGGDRQEVYLLDPHRRRIQVSIWRAVPAQNAQRWERHTFDLTPYRGRSFLLYFNVFNDGDNHVSAMFLDDVRVWVCQQKPTPTPVSPLPTPTYTSHLPNISHQSPPQPPVSPTPTPAKKPRTGPMEAWEKLARLPGHLQNLSQQTWNTSMALLQKLCLGLIFLLIFIVLLGIAFHIKKTSPKGPENE